MNDSTQIRYRSYDWDRPFDPNEYRSPKAITLLYESWLQAASDLSKAQEESEKLVKQVGELDKSQALLKLQLDSSQRRKWIPFVLQLIAVICGGVGVNILTSQGNTTYGWLFIGISLALEVIAFFVLKSEA